MLWGSLYETSAGVGATLAEIPGGLFTIEFFEDDNGRSPVEEWMDSELPDIELAALLAGLEHLLSHRGIGVCRTEWGKQPVTHTGRRSCCS